MCKNCKAEVDQMDIRDTDLLMLPYDLVKWHCSVPGCKGGLMLRDYGISPLYYWPVKVKYWPEDHKTCPDGWRGGWVSVLNHGLNLCWKHIEILRVYQKADNEYLFNEKYDMPFLGTLADLEQFQMSLIKPYHPKNKSKKRTLEW